MEPERLKSIRGWEWVKQGYALFVKAPLLWIVLLAVCVLSAITLSIVPIIGEPLVSLLMPVLLVGLMAGCRALNQGEELELAHLFSGIKHHVSPLVTLGGITLVSQYLIFGLMKAAGGTNLVELLMNGQPDTDPQVLMQAIAGAGVAMLLGVVLFSVLTMAMQFAPMLVYFRNVPPLHAMRLSLSAFTHNVGAMLVYGVTLMALSVLASLPMMLGWLVLLPLVFTSIYASYSDLFPPLPKADAETRSDTPPQDDVIKRDDSMFP